MNEHIAKLAEEATYEMEFGGNVLQTTNDEFSYEIPAGFIVKFTEMFIDILHQRGWTDAGNDLQQHFGVEK